MQIKHTFIAFAASAALLLGTANINRAHAAQYTLDPTHSFVQFSIAHLGYSLLQGRFNTLSGSFSYDPKQPNAARIAVEVETASIDSNHAERDKHLRGADFLDVENYPKARFVSSAIHEANGKATVRGDLTLHGVTRPVRFEAELIGAGKDPWGGYRRGYKGSLTIKRADFGVSYNLGPAAETMRLDLFIEGIRQ
nr:YceI family protein [Magnetofaba australis]